MTGAVQLTHLLALTHTPPSLSLPAERRGGGTALH